MNPVFPAFVDLAPVSGPGRRRWACLGAVLLGALLPAGCGDSPVDPDPNGDVVGGVDLAALFAPSTSAERATVEADWAQRSPSAEGVVVVEDRELSLAGATVRVRVVSHLVDGQRHFGAILQTPDTPAEPVPIMVYSHGGDRGVSLEEVLLVGAALGWGPADQVIVVPSFRSEALRLGDESWVSEGAASPWDRDVDDAFALVDVARTTVPFADGERVGVLGFSRGGAVGLLMGIRDTRIRAIVSYFAPTDFFGPFVRDVVREILEGTPRNLPGLDVLAREFVEPLRAGSLAMDAVRLELLRRSPARFADRLPRVQIHHGTADDVVPVDEAEHLISAMDALGRGPPEFEAWIYPGAGHSPLGMPESIERTRTFLASGL